MMRSMFAGVVGLQAHQIRMDVIGNNIANVNTIGFKASRVSFSDLLSQTLRSASRPQDQRGGTNPMQIGLGVALASITPNMTSGAPQVTGRDTDMAINGDGFFVLRGPGGGQVYSRDGSFLVDPEGYLTNSQGLRVLGWMARADGSMLTTAAPETIRVRGSGVMPARATTTMTLAGALNRNATVNATVSHIVTIYDADGTAYDVTFTFKKTQDGDGGTGTPELWSYSVAGPAGSSITGGTGTLQFDDTTGALTGSSTTSFTLSVPGKSPLNVSVDMSQFTLPQDFAATASGAPYTRLVQVQGGLSGTSMSTSFTANLDDGAGSTTSANFTLALTRDATDPNLYTYAITTATPGVTVTGGGSGTIRFDPGTGAVALVTGGPLQATYNGASTTMDLDFSGLRPLDIRLTRQDGHPEQEVAGLLAPKATSRIAFEQNLDPAASTYSTTALLYDHLGTAHTLTFNFSRLTGGWSYTVSSAAGTTLSGVTTGYIAFTADGSYDPVNSTVPGITLTPAGGKPVSLQLDFSRVTQVSGESTLTQSENLPTSEKGYPAGTFEGFGVDQSGTITGVYSNGVSQPLAQLALALFSNPSGLENRGGYWVESNNSGQPKLGAAGTGGRGTLQPGAVEMSNVDLATEFTNMITTQRGYQANSRVITTADELLQELMNLKR